MKRCLSLIIAIIIISILFCQITASAVSPITTEDTAIINNQIEIQEIVITQRKSEDAENFLWETLNKYIDNEKIVAGIMGYFYRESYYNSNSVAGLYLSGPEYEAKVSQEFLETIDAGLEDGSSKEEFITKTKYQYGGYGLGQWCALLYLDSFYDFAQDWGTSIADAEMQCAFTVQSIKNHPTELWDLIKDEENVEQIGRYIGIFYDGSPNGAEIMAGYAVKIYEKYGTG